MKVFKELPPTKKYAVGTVHEMVGGEFQIIDRWLGEDGFVMLKYIFPETGLLEENREVNIASALAKYKKKLELEKSKDIPNELKAVKEELRAVQEQMRVLILQQVTILQKLENIESSR